MIVVGGTKMKNTKPCINVIMPMLGGGTRMAAMQQTCKPLMTLPDGTHFFRKALQSLANYKVHSLALVVLEDFLEDFQALKSKIKEETRCDFLFIIPHSSTPTPVHSVMVGIKRCPCLINSPLPLVILDCDIYGILPPIPEEQATTARLFWFHDCNPNKSFIESAKDDETRVIKVVEKQAISDKSILGAYMFYDKSVFEFLKEHLTEEYKYVTDVLNYYLRQGKIVKCSPVEGRVSNFGTREEYEKEYGK